MPLGAGAAYAGPGDVATSTLWGAWWGLRAYTLASIGGNVMDLVREDAATITIGTVAGGGLDMATLTPWMAGHTAKLTKLYDQTGNGNDLTQTTDGVRPALTMSGLNSKPVMTFAGGQCLAIASPSFPVGPNNPDILAPFAFSVVGKSAGTVVSVRNTFLAANSGAVVAANRLSAADTWELAFSTAVTPAALDNVYHTGLGLFGTAVNSVLYIDGSISAASDNSGASANSGSAFRMGASSTDGTTQPLAGTIVEGGVYAGDLSAFNTSLNSNQTTYWGPF